MIKPDTNHEARPLAEMQVEVAHEVLIRHWDQLQQWLVAARNQERTVARVRSSATQYYDSGEDPDELTLRGNTLEQSEKLLYSRRPTISSNEAEFIRRCKAARQAEEEAKIRAAEERAALLKWAAAITVSFGVLAIGLAVWAEVQRREATNAKDETERVLAEELFRPLGHTEGLESGEIDALYALAGLLPKSEGVRDRFVELALGDPGKAERFGRRAEFALHAAVGLDGERKQRVLRLLIDSLRNSKHDGVRLASALGVAALQPTSSEWAGEASRAITSKWLEIRIRSFFTDSQPPSNLCQINWNPRKRPRWLGRSPSPCRTPQIPTRWKV